MSTSSTANAVNPVPRRFAMFVVCILLMSVVSTYLATYFLLNNAFDEVQSDYTAEAFLQIQNDFVRFVENRVTLLSDEAERSNYTTAVMSTLSNTAPLKDYLEKQVLLGQKVQLALLDINGVIVESSFDPNEAFSELAWIENLIEGNEVAYTEVMVREQPRTLLLRLAVPVLYRDLPEGVLVAEMALDTEQLEKALNHKLNSLSLSFVSAEEELIANIGASPSTSAAVSSFLLPYSNTKVLHTVNLRNLDATLNELLGINMLITVVLAGVFLVIFHFIGTRVFIKPQQLLVESERRTLKTNKKLQVANEELSQFAYRSSHDLRSPLITVKGLVDFSRQDLATGNLKEVDFNLAKIGKHVSKLDLLVADILELSRADFDDVEESAIDISQMCEDFRSRLYDDYEVDAFEVTFINKLDRDFVSQPARIAQIVENLTSNAFKYRDKDKPSQYVRLALSEEPGGTLLSVADNGLGIPSRVKDEVFVMFKRFHPTLAVGSGLGLSIIKKHVEQLNGRIDYESSAEGTTFRIFFPFRASLEPIA